MTYATNNADFRVWLVPITGRRLFVDTGKKGPHAVALVEFCHNPMLARGLRTDSQVSSSRFAGQAVTNEADALPTSQSMRFGTDQAGETSPLVGSSTLETDENPQCPGVNWNKFPTLCKEHILAHFTCCTARPHGPVVLVFSPNPLNIGLPLNVKIEVGLFFLSSLCTWN